MAKMGKYCKAYPIVRLRKFNGWSEKAENASKLRRQIDGKEVESTRQLTDADFLYLREDFTVTDGIFLSDNVIFDNVTPEWIEFCRNELNFKPQPYQTDTIEEGGR